MKILSGLYFNITFLIFIFGLCHWHYVQLSSTSRHHCIWYNSSEVVILIGKDYKPLKLCSNGFRAALKPKVVEFGLKFLALKTL